MNLQNQISKKIISVHPTMKGKLYAIWKKRWLLKLIFWAMILDRILFHLKFAL